MCDQKITSEKYLFFAKTNDAFLIKVLVEVLSQSLKTTALFVVDTAGICLRMFDAQRSIMFDMNLDGDKFHTYKFFSKERDTKLHVGLALTYFNKILKSVRKKDTINLFILADDPSTLSIQIIPSFEGNVVTTTEMKIQDVDVIEMGLPENYSVPVVMLASEYQKLIKNMSNLGNSSVVISTKSGYLHFDCDVGGGVLKRNVSFKLGTNSSEVDSEFYNEFNMEQLSKINKISAFTSHVQFYIGEPLKIQCIIGGGLGTISIFIKSNAIN